LVDEHAGEYASEYLRGIVVKIVGSNADSNAGTIVVIDDA